MNRTVHKAAALRGTLLLPADKSIAHRSALFAAIAEGCSHITNFPASADPRSTLACLRQLGVAIREARPGAVTIDGRGRRGLRVPSAPLDCGNSGTTMRLLSGVLAGHALRATLIGDESLMRRPMGRIADPLRSMGARIDLTDGHAPIRIRHDTPLRGITYTLPVPSAQVKSCVLLAGLYARGTTCIIEPLPSRDHTERMLHLPVTRIGGAHHITATAAHPAKPFSMVLPRDFSAASFFLVAGSIIPGGPLLLPGVGVNPTRSALLTVLQRMGADIRVNRRAMAGDEPVADLEVRPARLQSVTLDHSVMGNLIDEVPVLAVAAACARGRTTIRGAQELRVKECDRIHATVTNLRALGAAVEEYEDGFAIEGGRPLVGTRVDSFQDHRIAMAAAIAGLTAEGQTTIARAEVASVSFPGFWDALTQVTAREA